jgi:hypothetical protein
MAMAAWLGGCSYLGLNEAEWKNAVCPNHLILKNAAQMRSDGGDTPDWAIRIDRLGAECRTNGERVEMTLAVKTQITRARADVTVPPTSYFVAIMNGDDQVVSKQMIAINSSFDANPLDTIDIGNAELQFSEIHPAYNIFVGFEHPSDQPKE